LLGKIAWMVRLFVPVAIDMSRCYYEGMYDEQPTSSGEMTGLRAMDRCPC